MKKQNKKKSWFHKYRVSVLDEYTLEEAFHLRMTRMSFVWLWVGVVLGLFALFTVMYLYTPLKRLSPGYSDSMVRTELIQESMRLDSINRVVEMQRNQMSVIKAILAGEIAPDSSTTIEDFKIIEKDFLAKSEQEKQFCAEYEAKEKYNLSSIETKKNDEIPIFFKPVKGVLKKGFDLQEKHFGCDLMTSPNEAVVSIYEGTVVMAEYTTNSHFVIGVMHENDYLSVYKYNARLLKNVGDKVQTGEVIAVIGAGDDDGKPYLHFELWQKGTPLNPLDYISF